MSAFSLKEEEEDYKDILKCTSSCICTGKNDKDCD